MGARGRASTHRLEKAVSEGDGFARVLVTGSREWTDFTFIRRMLDVADVRVGPIRLVHGGARGADQLAASAQRLNHPTWPIEEHLADWSLYGKVAGMVRNRHMVDLGADLCLAFILDGSRGATMCADLAEKSGIETWRFNTWTRQPTLWA